MAEGGGASAGGSGGGDSGGVAAPKAGPHPHVGRWRGPGWWRLLLTSWALAGGVLGGVPGRLPWGVVVVASVLGFAAHRERAAGREGEVARGLPWQVVGLLLLALGYGLWWQAQWPHQGYVYPPLPVDPALAALVGISVFLAPILGLASGSGQETLWRALGLGFGLAFALDVLWGGSILSPRETVPRWLSLGFALWTPAWALAIHGGQRLLTAPRRRPWLAIYGICLTTEAVLLVTWLCAEGLGGGGG